MNNNSTRRMVESGVLIAVGLVLSIFKIFEFPFGGSITLASMLPVVLISYRHGVKWGVFTAFVYSITQILTGFSTVRALFLPDSEQTLLNAILIIVIDYVLAYTALGLGGIFRNKIKNTGLGLCLGSIVALAVCYLMHFISGFIFYGSYAEWFFTQDSIKEMCAGILTIFSGNGLAAIYSAFYNGCYMIPEMIITGILAFIIGAVPVIAKFVKPDSSKIQA